MSSSQFSAAAKPVMSKSATAAKLAKRSPDRANGHAVDLFDEKGFTRLLALERKRTERSRRPFILMLLDLGDFLEQSEQNKNGFAQFVATLAESTRETDGMGWYKHNRMFGVLFTEIGASDTGSVIRALHKKVSDVLWRTLSIDNVNSIHLSFHVYPEESPSSNDRPPDLTLYPDQAPEQDPRRAARAGKRAIDILGSLFGLALLSPLLIGIALAVKLTSRGPVLFRQKRVGRYGAMFTFLKFRSMYMANDESIHKEYVAKFISGKEDDGAPSSSAPVFKIKNDPRVTRIGRFLRRSSLDELPQLLNVLRGEMSLVGPRPPVPYEVECYELWHRRRLLTVKPGITGLWQVSGRSRVKFDDMVRLDLLYAETWSVWLDLKILWKTPAAVLSGEGAY